MTTPLTEGDECPADGCAGELVAVPDGKLVCVACGEAVGETAQ